MNHDHRFNAWDVFHARDIQGNVIEECERRFCYFCNGFEERNHQGERVVYDAPRSEERQ